MIKRVLQPSIEGDEKQQEREISTPHKHKNVNILFRDENQISSPSPRILSSEQDDQVEANETQPVQQENDHLSDCIETQNQYGQRKRFSLLTGIEEFGKYSLGLHIFFDQLKEMIKIFFIMVLISVPSLYTNYTGRSIENISSTNKLSFFLLQFTPINQQIANIQIYQANTQNSQKLIIEENNKLIVSDFLTTIASNRIWLVVPDICYCLVFIILALRLYKRQKKIGKKRNKRSTILTTSDYTLEITGFPSNLKNPEELLQFFSQYGEVKQCYLGRKYSGILQYFLKQFHLMEQIKFLKEMISSQNPSKENIQDQGVEQLGDNDTNNKQENSSVMENNMKVEQMKEQHNQQDREQKKLTQKIKNNEKLLKELEKKIKHIRNTKIGYEYYHDDYPSVVCYITFNRLSSRQSCIQAYKQARSCIFSNKKYPEELKFRGIYKLQINQYVSEPSNIMWENLGVRLFVVLVTSLFMIFILVCIAFIINYKLFSITPTPNCIRDRFYTYSEAASSSKLRECFCHQYEFDSIYQNQQIQTLCGQYINQISNVNYKSLLISYETLLINYIIEMLIVRARSFFKFTSHTEQSNTLAILIFLTTSLNIFIQLHLSAYGFSIWHTIGKIMQLYQDDENGSNLIRSVQNIVDYNRAWSFTIGLNVQYSFFIGIILPHTSILIIDLILKQIRKSKNKKYAYSLPKNIKDMFNSDFTIYKFQAVILNTIFFAFIYSSNAPLLLLFTLLSLTVQYWIYKFTIIRISKKPPQYDYKLGNLILKILPIAIILHLIVSILCYTNSNIFPTIERKPIYNLETNYEFDQADDNKNQISLNLRVLLDRIKEMKFFIVLIALMISGLLFQTCMKEFLNKLTLCLRNRRIYTEKTQPINNVQNEQLFEDFVNRVADSTLTTYDILQNKKYSKVIQLLDNKKEYSKPNIQVQKPLSTKFELVQEFNSPFVQNKKFDKIKENVKDNNFESITTDSNFNGFRVILPSPSQKSQKNNHRLGTPIPERTIFKKIKEKQIVKDNNNHNNNLQVIQTRVINIPTEEEGEDLEISEHHENENDKESDEYNNEFV